MISRQLSAALVACAGMAAADAAMGGGIADLPAVTRSRRASGDATPGGCTTDPAVRRAAADPAGVRR